MELQIQDLVSSIKKDGIDSANREAAAIVAEAKRQADAIIADAKKDSDKLREDAKAEVEVFKSSAELSVQQAKRDAVLAFRQEIQKEFEKLLAADIGKALDQQALVTLIKAAVQGEDVSAYAVEVGQVTDGLRQELARELLEIYRELGADGPSFGADVSFDLLLPETQTQPFLARVLDLSAGTIEGLVGENEYRAFPLEQQLQK